jgi:hypothetical protein
MKKVRGIIRDIGAVEEAEIGRVLKKRRELLIQKETGYVSRFIQTV